MMNNMDMLEWMNDLDAKYLYEAKQPAIQQTKSRRRLIPTLVAAAAASLCLTVGVCAYINYNKQMVQFGFGTLGEARMAELVAPEPVTYDNGIMSVTVENVLSDGVQAMLLLTVEPVDKTMEIAYPDHSVNEFIQNEIVIGDETYRSHIAINDYWGPWEQMDAAGQRWYKVFFTLPENVSEEELANARFNYVKEVWEKDGETHTRGELFDGISIPIDMRQNTDAIKMQSEDGLEMTLSGFELYQVGYLSNRHDWWNMVITWKNGEQQRITYSGIAGSHQSRDDDEPITWGEFAVPTTEQIDSESVTGNINFNGPEDWCGFIDVNDVASFQFGDRIYYPVS